MPKRNSLKRLLLASTIAATTMGAASFAHAADSPTTTQVAEIIVTAEKKSENLQQVPEAVTAVDSSTLIQQDLVKIQDFATRIPGLTVYGGGLTDLAIRGITTGGGTNPTVAITIDDVPFGSSSFAGEGPIPDLDPADLKQVEVLRGPQGTLYGASSLGGLIKYVTADPNTHTFTGRLEVGTESVDHGGAGWSTRGSANIPIDDGVAGVSISGFYRDDPGYIFNTLADVHNANTDHAEGGRVALVYHPTDKITINLSALSQQQIAFDGSSMDLNSNYSPKTGDLEHASGPQLNRTTDTYNLFEGRVSADLEFATLTSVTGFGESRDDQTVDLTNRFGFLLPIFGLPGDARVPLENDHTTDKFSEELRLSSPTGAKFEWLVGGFYTHEQTDTLQILNVTPAGGGATLANFLTSDIPSIYKEEAIFADGTYHFTDKFDVQFGGRVSDNHQRYEERDVGLLQGPPDDFVSGSNESSTTWLLTPRYHFSPDVMAYLRLATGYRPGGPNTALPSIPKTFHSDTVTNYELGLKGSTEDHRVTYDVALYWIDWKNIQLQETDPITQFTFFGNGSHAVSKGIELEGQWVPWEGMALGANASISDATLAASLPIGPTATIFGESGDRLPFQSKFNGNLSAEQDFPLSGEWSGYVGGVLTYVGQRYGNFAATAAIPRISLPDYTTLDLRAGVRNQSWTLNFFVRNVSDERGYSGGALQSPQNFSKGFSVNVIQPRTIGVMLSKTF